MRPLPPDPKDAGEIRTERLILRPIELADVDAFARIHADAEVVRHIGDGATANHEETAEWVERSISRNESEGFDRRAVILAGSGELIGWCGIAVWDIDGRRERELGYVLAREHWGSGYATEAAAAMRDRALGALGLRRLIALIAHGNEASEAVARRLGMAYERDAPFHGRLVQLYSMEA